MILCKRVRAPRGALSSRTLQWPVTVFRARLHMAATRRPDPFARLILDLARLGQHDPERIAAMVDVDPELVRAILATMLGDGSLDGQGRITAVGERRRADAEVDEQRIGWIIRDDLSGAALPFLAESDLRRTAPRSGEVELRLETRAGMPDLGWRMRLADALKVASRLDRGEVVRGHEDDEGVETMADAERRKAIEADVELVGEGIWDALAVDVWFDRGEDGPAFRAGCPFGRVDDGARYLRRLEQARANLPVLDAALRELRREADERFLLEVEEEKDEAVLAARERLLADIRSRSLPPVVRREIEDAVIRRMRAENGRERPGKVIHQYGIVAEAILFDLLPRHWAPDPTWLAEFCGSLPADPEYAAKHIAERTRELAPPDDDGVGFEIPESAARGLPELLFRLATKSGQSWEPKWRGWKNNLHGAALLAAPLVAAAVPPGAPRVSELLSAQPGLWRHLCVMLDHRNTKGAHLNSAPDETLRRAVESVSAAADAVLDALYPRTTP
jgi:hypothetical protein